MTSIYDRCPSYESNRFLLRLVQVDDAADLFLCYNDQKAQRIFNSDNCNTDFKFATLDHMRAYIASWLDAYRRKMFVRYSIIDKETGRAIGTVEIFGGEFGVLRIDVRSDYENEESLSELIKLSDSFFFDVETEKFITKAIPEAAGRVNALLQNGYTPIAANNREHYYEKRSPQNEA